MGVLTKTRLSSSLKRTVLAAVALSLVMPMALAVPASAAKPSRLHPCVVKGSHHKPKTTTKKEVLRPKTINQNNSNLAAGTNQQVQTGKTGTRTIYYTAKYKKGKLVGCKHTGTKVTVSPVNTVVSVGTYVAPPPPPPPPPPAAPQTYTAPSSPSQQYPGATAICNDGTPSYSAHHQGTCSHHGGVASWL